MWLPESLLFFCHEEAGNRNHIGVVFVLQEMLLFLEKGLYVPLCRPLSSSLDDGKD